MITRLFLLISLAFLGCFIPIGKTTSIEPATLALINGRVWLGSDSSKFVEAVAIRGNRIMRVGTTDEIKQVIDSNTQLLDLGGRLVAPGFNDAHIHFLRGSLGATEVDLTNAKSVAEIIERIGLFARQNPNAQWITGRGWRYSSFPGGLPTKSYLDAVVKNRPVFLTAYDDHSAWVNTRALQLAGIKRETKFDGYGEIVRDASNEPTGALKEGAQRLVARLIPEPTRERKLNALRFGMQLASRLGITSIQNAGGSADELGLYNELFKEGELTVRVSMAFSVGEQTTPEEIARFVELKNQYDLNPMLRAGAVKLVLDGGIESHTAAMIDRYYDLPENHGAPLGELAIPIDLFRGLVVRLDKAGFQIHTHAIGDRAVREALNAYELTQNSNNRKNTRHRVEHIESVSPTDVRRFAALGVLAAMEPIQADPATIEVWSKAIGVERLPYAFAWSSLLKSGTRLVYGSDWPASISLDPIRGLHNAVNRRTVDGHPPKGWVPQQRISLVEALRAYTQTGAYATFEESVKGRIAPEMLADLVVFSQDLFKVDSMKIHQTRVLLTIFDGKVIYRDSAW